jgi:hypothetical protein
MQRLLTLVLVTSLAVGCRLARPAPAPSRAPDFMRMLLDSAARSGPDAYESCDDGGHSAFVVEVLDSITLKPAAWGALLTWRSGRTVQTHHPLGKYPMRTDDISGFSGPPGRPGTYDVLVRKPGYRDWYRTGVKVEGTINPRAYPDCTVTKPVHLRALLQRGHAS